MREAETGSCSRIDTSSTSCVQYEQNALVAYPATQYAEVIEYPFPASRPNLCVPHVPSAARYYGSLATTAGLFDGMLRR